MATLIALVLFLFVIAGLVTGIILWATAGKATAGGEMSCGSCGYAVKGLTQLNCPECGADLREAGINRGGSPTRRVFGITLTIVCSLLLLGGCLLPALFFSGSQSVSSPTQAIPGPLPNQSGGQSVIQNQADIENGEPESGTDEPWDAPRGSTGDGDPDAR